MAHLFGCFQFKLWHDFGSFHLFIIMAVFSDGTKSYKEADDDQLLYEFEETLPQTIIFESLIQCPK